MEVKEMATRTVELRTNERVFEGLSKQNMLFHQCIFELCDNAIAATQDHKKANINVAFEAIPDDNEHFYLYVCDDGVGMDADLLENSLQLGHEPTSNSRLNEHGFGLKNSLATLSGGNKEWTLWTRKKGGERQNILYVEGPFKPKMEIIDEATTVFPDKPFISADVSTVVKTKVKKSYAQTVQGRGAKANNLYTIRAWLVEHLGVAYRGYLSLDENTNETKAKINVFIGEDLRWDPYSVTPIHVPILNATTKYFTLYLGGEKRTLTYKYGTLDEETRNKLVKGEKAKYYYQGNMATQGIDIRLGDRVIATRQLETIWRTEIDGKIIERHNQYNDFVGELLIPELPRGVLTTVNNKTDFNLDDAEWVKVFDKMNEYRPIKNVREQGEADLRKKWANMLRRTNPDDTVDQEHHVWPTGVRIDVYREKKIGETSSIKIYELKVGEAKPIDLYQLKMYWDGLVVGGTQPNEGVLLAKDFHDTIQSMASSMNELTPPKMPDGRQSEPYNFTLTKLSDVGLLDGYADS
jgi:hypothetical protein